MGIRDKSTDDAILTLVDESGGELRRHTITRRLAHRGDVEPALRRLVRRKAIRVVRKTRGDGKRVTFVVRGPVSIPDGGGSSHEPPGA